MNYLKLKTTYLSLIALALLSVSCGSQSVKVLDAQWVSMKHAQPPENINKLASTGRLNESYCFSSWTGSFGLMDEVVKQAENKYHLDYIRNASFSKDSGRSCVSVVGEGFRITR